MPRRKREYEIPEPVYHNVPVEREEPCFPEGRYRAFSDDRGNAWIRDTQRGDRRCRTFFGETAWSDAARIAGDMNQADKIKQRRKDT